MTDYDQPDADSADPLVPYSVAAEKVKAAFLKGRTAGRDDTLAVIKALTGLNGQLSGLVATVRKAAEPVPEGPAAQVSRGGTPDAPEPADPHANLIAAMLDSAIDGAVNDEDDTTELHLLADWADDPAKWEEVTGEPLTVRKAFDESKHPRADNGRFIGKDRIQAAKADPEKADQLRAETTDPDQRKKLEAALSGEADVGRTKAGQRRHDAETRRANREASRKRATEIARKVLHANGDDVHPPTPEEWREFATHLPNLTVQQLKDLRAMVGAERGDRLRQDVIDKLVQHAKLEAGDLRRMPDRGPAPKRVGQVMAGMTGAKEPGPAEEPKNEPAAPVVAGPPPAVTGPARPKVEYVRAPAGGKVSDVDGKFYAGGQLMPVHGLYSGQPKPPPKPPAGTGGSTVAPDEEAESGGGRRQPAQPLTPEQIEEQRAQAERQRKWDDIRTGPLGRVKWTGEKPNRQALGNPVTNLQDWKEFADRIGEDKLKAVANILQARHDAKVDAEVAASGEAIPADAIDWEKATPARQAQDDAGMFAGSKAHLKKLPSSYLARQLVQYGIGSGTVDDFHAVNAVLADAERMTPAELTAKYSPTPKETPHAAHPGQQPQSHQPEHQGDGRGGPPPQPGRGGGAAERPGGQEGGQGQEVAPAAHAAAAAEVHAALQRGRDDGDPDPRGDVGQFDPAKQAEFSRRAAEYVASHAERNGGVGDQLDNLYAAVGGPLGLTPRQFRAALIEADERGAVKIGGWPKAADDFPRPDLMPVLGGKAFGYVHPRRSAAVQPQPQPAAPAPLDLRSPPALAAAVHAAARDLPNFLGRPRDAGAPAAERHPVYLSDVYDALRDRLPAGTTEGQFKHALYAAHAAGSLDLGRLDMMELGKPEKTARSEHRTPTGETFHLLKVPGR